LRANLDGTVTRLTGEGAFSDLCPSPDGRFLYALRSAICEPPQPVGFDLWKLPTPSRVACKASSSSTV
jgi:hypothetical protein